LNSAGNFVARYRYDAWGVPIAITDGNGNDVSNNPSHIANINPIRYRGYYYDTETGFYYLQTRYYDPEIGRFINADKLIDEGAGLQGCNIYVYCANNPVNNFDPTGEFAITISACIAIASILAGVSSASYTAYDSYKQTGSIDWTATVGNGLGMGLFVYSAGMTVYGGYINFCDYKGYTPVTSINIGKTSVPPSSGGMTAVKKTITAPKSNVKFNANQNAVIQLAKDNKQGLSRSNAKTLVDWANEYGLNNHGPMIHANRNGIWSYTEHIKISSYHIRIFQD